MYKRNLKYNFVFKYHELPAARVSSVRTIRVSYVSSLVNHEADLTIY